MAFNFLLAVSHLAMALVAFVLRSSRSIKAVGVMRLVNLDPAS